jgi:hypothetical protein
MKFNLDWEKALRMLGEILEFEGAVPVNLVACGGTAMLYQRLNAMGFHDGLARLDF